jgi:ankyrin repeat protein
VLTSSEDVDLEAKDPDGNSVYHICAELNNFESIRYLITRKEPKFQSALFNINKHNGNSVLHIACEHGNLEIIRLVFTSIDELSHLLTEEFIKSKNKNGHTCFHIACVEGYYNIVEYFAQDLRMSFFIEILDNECNNCLHLAAIHNNLNIAKLIIKHNIDLNQRNMDGYTVLDIGFQRGFFEIIKLLIMSDYDLSIQDVSRNECPLHTAAFKGAHEIVDLLLKKGLPLASLNLENKNCLEVALEQNHKKVIRILLKHKDWASLFKNNNKNHLQTLIRKKMFDMILIVLDNCRTEESYDFKILDPVFDDIQKHPLMLFAQSGQETILKHPTVKKLLTLKWRLVPQIAFYTNLLFYFLFLVLFTIYSLNLSNHINEIAKTNCTNSDLEDCFNNIELNQSSTLSIFLAIIIVLVLLKTCFQILLLDGLAYFNSLENLSELFLYFLALTSLFSTNFNSKLTSASLTILLTFIVFTFLIQKLKGIGLYVLAFRRTLNNSANFFPIFLIIFTGFNLSFRLQTSFAMSNLSLSPGGLIIKTFVMVLGEFGDSGDSMMGLNENSTINYVIYFLFISIVCAILVNLFIGIAVGEISTVLNEADVQQISMRIVFVLKVQKSLKSFISGPLTNKYFNLRFESYCYENEPKYIKIRDKLVNYFRLRFRSVEPSINLVVPQERLEEKFVEVSKITNTEIKNVKKSLARQLTEIEHKLSNSQLKLENYLLEMQSKTLTSFEVTKEDSNSSIKIVDTKLNGFTIKLIRIVYGYKVLVKLSFIRLKQMFKNSFMNFVSKLIKRQEGAENRIKNVGISAMKSQELFNLEFDARKIIFSLLADNISNLNQKTKYLRAKMEEFENFHKKKLERDLLIEKFLEKASCNMHDAEFFKALTKSQSKFELNRMKFELKTIIQNKIINNRTNSKNNF